MKHFAKVTWAKHPQESFTDHCYHRTHQWQFDGGAHIQASSSPHIVPVPMSDPALVDPEETFLASVASCHMLFFLHIAAQGGYQVLNYSDEATSCLQKNQANHLAFTHIQLKPVIDFRAGKAPSQEQLEKMHVQAHKQCFIAQSIRASIDILPTLKISETYERFDHSIKK
ncbi:MAG TPA: peroxiredoxin [Microscillaceae bacterium]|nr:peroxiredoxin [Microscillaceae bacterium]